MEAQQIETELLGFLRREVFAPTVELTAETEAVKVVVTNDEWQEGDPAYAQNADGWPRILSRLKTLLETGKTFRPH